MNLTISTREHTGSTVITVSGEMDLDSCPALDAAINATPPQGVPLRLDLSEVTFMDSSGLNLLLRLHHRLSKSGSRLILTGIREEPMRVLRLTGADTILTLGRQPNPQLSAGTPA